jgi:hypothetical protein
MSPDGALAPHARGFLSVSFVLACGVAQAMTLASVTSVTVRVDDPELLVYVIYFAGGELSKDELRSAMKPGPVAVDEASSGGVIATRIARWELSGR